MQDEGPFISHLIQAAIPSPSFEGKIVVESIGGGSINHTYRIRTDHQHQFCCKTNNRSRFPGLFESERNGLKLLSDVGAIKTPEIISCGVEGEIQFLILEWIEPGTRNNKFWRLFGEKLARQHQVNNRFFGLKEDNYMGALPQSNHPNENWTNFYISERLSPQIRLAADNRMLTQSHVAQFENLFNSLPDIFSDERPSLVHGDLWNGNFICDKNGLPVLIDPAVYFGHRMVDIAMTRLFGGFDNEFYKAYQYQFPIVGNEVEQTRICQLYPLLIHLNLFGKSYLDDISRILDNFS
ncbi:MAG: hypothetical protein C5B59_05405 [Bacteroidetes bacterium]|nr:MAG: hypothetical protein C5B59_05405 [Bacteroidota bacterium]